jgi:hypothetical protein
MKIYMGRIPHADYKSWIWRKGGNFLLRLHGINYDFDASKKDLFVEPVYIPTLIVNNEGGILLISLRLRGEEYRNLILFKQYPFICIERSNSITLGLEEDE